MTKINKIIATFTVLFFVCLASSYASEVKIGTIVPLSGPYSSAGHDVREAIELIVNDVNKKGGINGNIIELVIKDSQSSPATAVSQLRSLIEDSEVVGEAGPFATIELSPMKHIVKESKFPLCAASSSPRAVNLPEAEYVWRCWVTDHVGMEAAFKVFSEDMGIKRVGILAQADAFGEGIKTSALELGPKYALEITKIETFHAKDTDMTVQLAKLKLADSEVVVCGGNVPTTGYIVKSAGAMGWDVPMYAGAPGADPSTAEIGGEAAEGFIISTNFIPGNPRPGAQSDFASKWNKKTGKQITLGALLGACTVQVLLAAIEKASLMGEVNRKTVAAALQNLEVNTAGGKFTYTPNSHEGGTVESIVFARMKEKKWVIWTPKPIQDRFDWK